MCDENQNKTNLGDELGRVFKLGVGAVAGAVEKGIGFVGELTTEGTDINKRAAALGEELTRKGEEVIGKTTKLGSQLKDKVVGSIPVNFDGILGALEGLADHQLEAIKDKLEQVLAGRAQQAQQPQDEAAQPQENQDGQDGQ